MSLLSMSSSTTSNCNICEFNLLDFVIISKTSSWLPSFFV